MVVMENKSITKSTITSAFCIACITAIFAVLQMALAYYMYNVLKSDFNEAFLNEIRSGVCKEEIQRILTNPEFPFYKSDMKIYIQSTSYVDFLNARYREDGEKDPEDDSIQPIEVTKVPLETVLEFCKTIVEKCPNRSSPRNIRRRRSIAEQQQTTLINNLKQPGRSIVNINGKRLAELVGKPGPPGPPGSQGRSGPPGSRGPSGPPGLAGPQGLLGLPGKEGPTGKPGFPGLKGEPGSKGDLGLIGMPGVPGSKGERGDLGVPKDGKKGDVGAAGPSGPKGDMGVPGRTGPQGVKGDKGEVGRSGWDGLPGPKGDQGERGIPGEIQTPTPPPPVKGSSDDYRRTWTATKYGKENYPQLPPRTKRCVLQSIGQPKSKVYISAEYGSWMVDSYPPTNADADKNWVTVTEENNALFEYKKLTAPAEKNYVLKKTVRGNSQAIYKGFFYYQSSEEKPTIVKYCLLSQTTQELQVPGLTAENSKPLYTTSINHLDFSVDENGLWVIFAVPNSNNTGVMKVDPDSLRPQHIWDVSVNHLLFNEMFIASGILYGIDDITTKDKRVSLLIDLYTGKSEKVDIDVDARHGMGSMATYDFLGKKIMTWNMGSLVSYPVTCEESQSK